MPFMKQGTEPNCGAFATAYFFWAAKKVKPFDKIYRTGDEYGDEDTINEIYENIRLGEEQVPALCQQYKQMLGPYAPDGRAERMFFSPKSNLAAEDLGGISMPDKIKSLLEANGVANIKLYMPGSPKSVITLLYNMMGPDAKSGCIRNRKIDNSLILAGNACIELVFVQDANLESLHYVFSYPSSTEKGVVYYVNPWLGYAKERSDLPDKMIDEGFKLRPTGAGVVIPIK